MTRGRWVIAPLSIGSVAMQAPATPLWRLVLGRQPCARSRPGLEALTATKEGSWSPFSALPHGPGYVFRATRSWVDETLAKRGLLTGPKLNVGAGMCPGLAPRQGGRPDCRVLPTRPWERACHPQ